jgi:hypothetical protein
MSDISPAQLRAARALVGTSLHSVARALHLSGDTIWRAEIARGTERTKAQLAEYWQRQGVEFAPGGWVRRREGGVAIEPPPGPEAVASPPAVEERRGSLVRVEGVWRLG